MENPITLIITTSGYVESGQVGFTSWSWLPLSKALPPLEAIQNLANNLLENYLNSWLGLSYEESQQRPKCCKYREIGFCNVCNSLNRGGFDIYEFKEWIYAYPRLSADEVCGNELTNWWQWNTAEDILLWPKENILIIRENFEGIMANLIDRNQLTAEEAGEIADEDSYPFYDNLEVVVRKENLQEINLVYNPY